MTTEGTSDAQCNREDGCLTAGYITHMRLFSKSRYECGACGGELSYDDVFGPVRAKPEWLKKKPKPAPEAQEPDEAVEAVELLRQICLATNTPQLDSLIDRGRSFLAAREKEGA